MPIRIEVPHNGRSGKEGQERYTTADKPEVPKNNFYFRRKNRGKVKPIPLALGGSIWVLTFISGGANIWGYQESLNVLFAQKIVPVFSFGGLLLIPALSVFMQVIAGIALVLYCVTNKEQKDWLDYLMLILWGWFVLFGFSGMVDRGPFVAALAIWLLTQSVQYKAITGDDRTLWAMAGFAYIFEFIFQCIASPVISIGFWEFLVQLSASAFDWQTIDYAMLGVNIACIGGVEWLSKLRLAMSNGK